MPAFELDARLAADTLVIGDWPLSRLLLMNDAQFPWTILVPRRAGLREIHELSEPEQRQLLRESNVLGRTLMALYSGEKLNIAALGNIVAQLHLHHIARRADDAAWPAPVWGRLPAQPYSSAAAAQRLSSLRPLLAAALPLRA